MGQTWLLCSSASHCCAVSPPGRPGREAVGAAPRAAPVSGRAAVVDNTLHLKMRDNVEVILNVPVTRHRGLRKKLKWEEALHSTSCPANCRVYWGWRRCRCRGCWWWWCRWCRRGCCSWGQKIVSAPVSLESHRTHTWARGGGRGGDTVRLTFPLVSPPP